MPTFFVDGQKVSRQVVGRRGGQAVGALVLDEVWKIGTAFGHEIVQRRWRLWRDLAKENDLLTSPGRVNPL